MPWKENFDWNFSWTTIIKLFWISQNGALFIHRVNRWYSFKTKLMNTSPTLSLQIELSAWIFKLDAISLFKLDGKQGDLFV